MKSIFIALTILTFGLSAHSEEMELQLNNSANLISEASSTATFSSVNTQKLNPKWRFGFGQSSLKAEYGSIGRGLNVFFERGFNHFVGAGGSFTNYNFQGTDAPIAALYSTLTPIRYGIEEFLFTGSVIGGIQMQVNDGSGPSKMVRDTFFYGASVDFNLSNQIGLNLTSKAGLTYQAINEISLVGYF